MTSDERNVLNGTINKYDNENDTLEYTENQQDPNYIVIFPQNTKMKVRVKVKCTQLGACNRLRDIKSYFISRHDPALMGIKLHFVFALKFIHEIFCLCTVGACKRASD